jgi:hypothetical protein
MDHGMDQIAASILRNLFSFGRRRGRRPESRTVPGSGSNPGGPSLSAWQGAASAVAELSSFRETANNMLSFPSNISVTRLLP